MASVTVTTAAAAAPTRKRVVLKAGSTTIVLPITNPATDLGAMGATWTALDRPGMDQLLRYGARNPRVVTLDVRLIPLNGVSPHRALDLLDDMANGSAPISVSYGSTETGTYRMTGLRPKVVQRLTNQTASEAEVTIELTRIGDERIKVPSRVTPPKPASSTSSKKSTASTSKKRVVHYTVKRGDTLIKIATKVCHNSAHWQRIAKDNHIRDPRKLQVGKKLTITCL